MQLTKTDDWSVRLLTDQSDLEMTRMVQCSSIMLPEAQSELVRRRNDQQITYFSFLNLYGEHWTDQPE